MYEDVKEYLAWAREKVNEAAEKTAEDLQNKFFLSVDDVMRGGKRFRPALTLLSAQAIAGDDAWQKATDYAVAVEMIHSFSLNIDDILDMDEIRRGKPSEWVMMGLLPAFLAGIGGITQAFALGSRDHRAMKVLNETIQAMASGAVKEMVSGNIFKRDFLMNIIVLKTGALMATAAQMGAIAVNAPSSVEEAFRKYGLNIGIAYQMQDDLNDIILSLREMKPHGDLKDYRLTMPMYIIHESFPNLGAVIDSFLERKIDFEHLASNMLSSGGTKLFMGVSEEIEDYVGRAIHAINGLTLHERYREILVNLPYYMIDAMKKEMIEDMAKSASKSLPAKESNTTEKEPEQKEDTEEFTLPAESYTEWIKTLPPSHIAAVSLINMGMDDKSVIDKTNITEKELIYLKKVLSAYNNKKERDTS